ncbi:hypothetical protein T36_1195 [Helicobacter cinaedi]|uniref:hypothetical protein n=1 Tax=Helicobacter cinaedi TaxID=213 RepID=UPI001F40ECE6|nr:hypothetical protein [Helicobacter cinaedi]BDB64738.1 hypothetical protein T36_1195 [Helicobacter cinaedi]
MLFVLYTLAFGLMLLNTRGYYWDDWGLIGNFSFDSMNQQFLQNGNIWYGYFEWIFISLQPYGIQLFRFFTFFSFFICGLCVYHIAKSLQILKTYELFFIVVFFLLLPFNTISRNALINAPYTLCYLLFFLAFFLVSVKSTQHILTRILTLALFFISFTMNSLLIFYILPLVYLLYTHKAYTSFKALWLWALKHFDFIFLPIVFYAIKILFFKPYGLYEGYNAVSVGGFFKAFIKTPIFSVLHLVHTSFFLLGSLCVIALILGAIVFIYRLRHRLLEKRDIFGIGLGFIIMWAGMFSYVVVFKYVAFDTVADRFGILESLGAGIILVFFVNLLTKNTNYKMWILGILTLCATHYNIISQQRVFMAYVKQVGVFEQLMQNPTFLSHDTFRIYDTNRGIYDNAFYRLNGIYAKLSNKSDKFIISDYDGDIHEMTKYCKVSPTYNCWEYNGDINNYGKVFITDKRNEFKNIYNLLADMRLYVLDIFSHDSFKHKAKNRYEVVVLPPES